MEQPDDQLGAAQDLSQGADDISLRSEARSTRLRAAVLSIATGFFVVFLYLFSPFLLIVIGWFLDPFADTQGGAEISHRVHEVTFGLLFGIAMVGALAQLRHPERNVAGMQQTILAITAFVSVSIFTTGFEPVSLAYILPVVAAAIAHPERRRLVVPSHPPHPGLALLALSGFLLISGMVERELAKASAAAQGHETHWGTVAAFGLTVSLMAVLVAFRPAGWRLTAVSTAVALLGYVAASSAFPFDASGRPGSRAFFMAIWSGALLFAAARVDRQHRSNEDPQVRRSGRKWAWAALALIPSLLLATCGAEPISPPNVPHRVLPSQLDREGCLSCHLIGLSTETGATPTDHPTRQCGTEGEAPCLVGQTGCMGCHRLGPNAVGVEASVPVYVGSGSSWSVPPGGGRPLTDALISVARRIAGSSA